MYYWEGSPVTVDRGSGVSESVNYWGCLNLECCGSMVAWFNKYDWIVLTVLSLLVISFVFGILSALYIRHFTDAGQEKILMHPQSKRIFIIMLLLILISCVAVAFSFDSGEFGEKQSSEQLRERVQLNSNYQPTYDKAVVVSCDNKLLDGYETDIDCGGTCLNKCGEGFGCSMDRPVSGNMSDCAEPLVCQSVEPASDLCFDKRCLLGQIEHASGKCSIQPACAENNQTDGLETCVDGGGPDCTAAGHFCAVGAACQDSADCEAGLFCSSLLTCYNCSNGVSDGDETSIDCGGKHCKPCGDLSTCASAADCASGNCFFASSTSSMGQCVSCFNNLLDGNESCVDGGGGCPNMCRKGDSCRTDADCLTGLCTGGNCTMTPENACSDGAMNGVETCEDGGGAICRSIGRLCNTTCGEDSDCSSGACFACECFSCTDSLKNGDESDIDCGGQYCAACNSTIEPAPRCLLSSDCDSGLCFYDGSIAAVAMVPSLSEWVLMSKHAANQAFSDHLWISQELWNYLQLSNGKQIMLECAGIDLGPFEIENANPSDGVNQGGTQQPLAYFNLKGANLEGKCVANTADTVKVPGVCISNSNGRQDGNETCVDGGGGTNPAKCVDGAGCSIDTDCVSLYCDATSKTCRPPTNEERCSNGQHDVLVEAGVDCGGVCSVLGKPCPAGSNCTSSSDCTVLCENGVCVSCADGEQNGVETVRTRSFQQRL
jgi:hypothetical protein